MNKIVFIFHDSCVYSGATASMVELIEGMPFDSSYSIFAILPALGDNTMLKTRLNAKNITTLEFNIYMTRCLHRSSLLKKAASFTLSGFAIIRCYLEARKAKKILGSADVIYTNTSATYFGIFLSKFLDSKHITHVREFGIEDQNMNQFLGEQFFYYNLNKYNDKIIVISKALQDKLDRYIPTEKLKLIYDDVNIKKQSPYKNRFCTKKTLKLLVAGTICEGKGQRFVIESLADFVSNNSSDVNIELSFAGNANHKYARELKEYTRDLGLDDIVSFLGHCSDMALVRDDYDVAVVASQSEAFGRVTIEAMSSSLLVVASDTGANMEIIKDKENGLIYKHRSTTSFNNVFFYIMSNFDSCGLITKSGYETSRRFTGNEASIQAKNTIDSMLG